LEEHGHQQPEHGKQQPEHGDQQPDHDDQQPEPADQLLDGSNNWLGEENNHSDEEEHQDDQENNASSDREEYDQEVEQSQLLKKLGEFADSLHREEEERSEAPVGLPDPGNAIIPPDGGHWTEPSSEQVEGGTAAADTGPTASEVDSYIIGLQQQQQQLEEQNGLPNPDDALLEPAKKKRKMLYEDSRAEGGAAD